MCLFDYDLLKKGLRQGSLVRRGSISHLEPRMTKAFNGTGPPRKGKNIHMKKKIPIGKKARQKCR